MERNSNNNNNRNMVARSLIIFDYIIAVSLLYVFFYVSVSVWKQENCRYKSWKDFGRVRAWLMTQLRWNEKREGRGKAQENCVMSDRRSLSLSFYIVIVYGILAA